MACAFRSSALTLIIAVALIAAGVRAEDDVQTGTTGAEGAAGTAGSPGTAGSSCRRIANRSVDTLGVVVFDVLPEQASQMVFAEHDDMIEELPANAADEALGGPVLPRASQCGAHGPDPEPFDREGDFC